ncbi:MAG TPA: SRPBCC family protein [Polyangiaceae bacterium]|nr:SRPBCC family protein [Polyangiaceae bacterium]
MKSILGTEFRRVENREYLGKPAIVGVATRVYDTSVEDMWDAITTPERLVRWFLPVEGDLKVGGRYQLKGNAGGTITRCDPPAALDLTWEFAGATSWVNVRLAAEGAKTRLTLEHIAHKGGIGEEHMKKFGPGATGVGWDLSLHGLKQHLLNPSVALDPAAFEAWSLSSEGKAFIRECGEAWGEAYIAAGADPEEARAQALRTIAFYTGAGV